MRIWVPDVNAPGFQAELDKEIAAINASADSKAVLAMAEAAAAELWSQFD